MTMAALGHVLAASVKTVPAVKPTTYKVRIADLTIEESNDRHNGCCACAVTVDAAALQRAVMKSRRSF